MTLTKLIDELKDEKMKGSDLPKIMIVLDSLGQMASNKEKEDLLKGNLKQDMTKAKAIGSMFRSINTDLGYLEMPMIVCNHTYSTMDMFPRQIMKGGLSLLYTASVVGMMSKSKLKTGEEDEMDMGQSGVKVLFKTQKNRLAKPKKIRFDISFINGMNPYTGLDAFCRPEYFEKIGICKGKMDVDKSTGEMKFIPGGNKFYVRHLDKSFFLKRLFTQEIFTQDVLEKMEPIINAYFQFKSIEELEETERKFNEVIEEDIDITLEDFDAGDLFN